MATNDIRDFVVQITEMKGEGGVVTYLGQVMESPRGHTAAEPLQTPFGDGSFEMLRMKLENAVLRSKDYRGAFESKEEKVLHQFGAGMFEVLFRRNESIRDCYEACQRDIDDAAYQGLRIKLEVASHDLASLPWEFMFDARPNHGNYLCLEKTSPVLRHLGNLKRQAHPPGRRVNVLAMVANPPGGGVELNVAREREVLDGLSKDADVGDRFNLSWVVGDRLEDLINHVNKQPWDIFHFVGHGGFDAEGADADADDSGYVVMGDGKGRAERVFASDLANTLRLCGSVQLAVLNCCESGRGNGPASPGAALARARIPAVVAMQYPIEDKTAIKFTDVFYRALLNGLTVEDALTTARVSMRASSKVSWGIPVLYSRSSSGESIRFWSGAAGVPDVAEVALRAGVAQAPAVARASTLPNGSAETGVSDQEMRRLERQRRVKALFHPSH